MAVKYMHTLNGEPAYYRPGQQIYYRPSKRFALPLANSLKQIKAEQKASAKFREATGMHDYWAAGYVKVETGK